MSATASPASAAARPDAPIAAPARSRLARRIALAYVALILAVTTLLGVYLTATLRSAQLAQLEATMAADARLIGLAAEPALAARDGARVDELARRAAAGLGARVTVIAADGTVLGDSDTDPAALENHAGRPEVAAVLRSGVPVGASARHSTSVDRDLLYVAVAVGDPPIGVARVARDQSGVEAEVWRASAAVVLALVAAGVLAALLSGLIARRVSRPIRRLTEAAKALESGQLDRSIEATGDDEIGELGQAFARMAARLRDTIETLSADRARLSAVLAAMGDGVVLVDRDERVILANRAASRLLGAPERPEASSRLIELVHDHELYELVRAAMATRTTRSAPVRLAPSGRHVQATATPMRGGGAAALLLLQDVTEVRRAEAVRRDFVANVSHELKTPIASIKALTETLEDGALDDPPAAREFLQRMHVEVDGLAQIVQELLDLSRLESGQAAMVLAHHAPDELVRAAADRLRAQAERAEVALSVDGRGAPPVRADAQRVEGALINLIHNAIKFTPPGGRVSVRAEAVEQPGASAVRFVVEDTGAGIALEDQPRLFERFYKADKSRASSGTGLGLAIVKHVVQAHGGEVGVESTPGQGSTFWFTLPGSAGPAPTPTPW